MALERGKGLRNEAHLIPVSDLKPQKEKLTLSIDRELKEWVKIYALRSGQTVSEVLEKHIESLKNTQK